MSMTENVELVQHVPYRKNTAALLIMERLNPADEPEEKVSELYSIGVTTLQSMADELTALIRQVMETGAVECRIATRVVLPNDQVINLPHDEVECEDRGCSIHHPTLHHMSAMAQEYDFDRELMLRQCLHGVKHPDPDDKYYHQVILKDDFDFEHTCCERNCCQGPRLSQKQLKAIQGSENNGPRTHPAVGREGS